jgi:hypothetical protein
MSVSSSRSRLRLPCHLVLGLAALQPGCSRQTAVPEQPMESSRVMVNPEAEGFVNVVTPDDFRRMTAADRAIVFIDVDWSPTSVMSRGTASEFARTMQSNGLGREVAFFRLDMTEQKDPITEMANDWIDTQVESRGMVLGGKGELLWLKQGQIVGEARYEAQRYDVDLLNQTVIAFGPLDPPIAD